MNHYITLDIGGTKILATLFEDGKTLEILHEKQVPTQATEGREVVLKNICKAIDALCDKCDTEISAIGISWAGFVDSKNGIIKNSPNIEGFNSFEMAKYFTEKYHIPTVIENDARLFALAEYFIQPTPPEVFLGIILGTGVGSGIIVNGKILHGAENFAGEIGHQATSLFHTDEKEEIEDVFAGPGLSEFFGKYLKEISDTLPEKKAEVLQKLQPRIRGLAHWIVNISLCLNPSKIVLGGGAGQHFWSHFLPEIHLEMEKILAEKNYPLTIHIEKAHLNNAGVVGAAVLAKKFVENKV